LFFPVGFKPVSFFLHPAILPFQPHGQRLCPGAAFLATPHHAFFCKVVALFFQATLS
jgi:hypothetical protein